MSRSAANRATNRNLIRAMVAGFTLVILLLLAAGGFGLREAQVMHEYASRTAAEQISTSSVLTQLRLEHRTMADALYRLRHRQNPGDESAILRTLDRLDETMEDLERRTASSPSALSFKELIATTRDFSALAHGWFQQPARDYQALEALLQHHQQVQHLAGDVILNGLQTATDHGKALEARANNLVRVSLALLGAGLVLAIGTAVLTVRFVASTLRLLEEQSTELSRVSWQMLQGQEEAARRFSHELHDELGQSLTAVKANLLSLNADSFEEKRADCIELVDLSISNVRELSQLLRPVILDDFGLDAAVRWLCDRFRQRTGIVVEYHSQLPCRLSDEAETQLFRITQEALTNIARHSHATAVAVQLMASRHAVTLTVRDNGAGLDLSRARQHGMGLVGMQARAEQAGGPLRLVTPKGGGLEVIAEIPLEEKPHEKLA